MDRNGRRSNQSLRRAPGPASSEHHAHAEVPDPAPSEHQGMGGRPRQSVRARRNRSPSASSSCSEACSTWRGSSTEGRGLSSSWTAWTADLLDSTPLWPCVIEVERSQRPSFELHRGEQGERAKASRGKLRTNTSAQNQT